MSDIPLRLRVLMALTNRLEQITTPNGYVNTLTGNVHRGRNFFDEDDALPLLAILESGDEPPQQIQPRGNTTSKNDWDLLVQGWVDDDKDNPTDMAHYLLADVKKCLAKELQALRERNALGMGRVVDAIEFSPGVVRPADSISSKAYFWMKLRLTLVENLSEPYADT